MWHAISIYCVRTAIAAAFFSHFFLSLFFFLQPPYAIWLDYKGRFNNNVLQVQIKIGKCYICNVTNNSVQLQLKCQKKLKIRRSKREKRQLHRFIQVWYCHRVLKISIKSSLWVFQELNFVFCILYHIRYHISYTFFLLIKTDPREKNRFDLLYAGVGGECVCACLRDIVCQRNWNLP